MPKLKKLWGVAETTYFVGASTRSVIAQLKAVAPELTMERGRGSHTKLRRFAVSAIESDAVVLAMIGTPRGADLHWLLIIGIEHQLKQSRTTEPPKATALLGLDPSEPIALLSTHNVRIELGKHMVCRWQNESDDELQLKAVLAVSR